MKASRLALARVFLSGIVFCLSAAFFLLPWSGAPSPIDSLPSLQFLPSIERTVIGALENRIVPGALAIVVLVIALTLVFGRLYCAFFCPLGALQDLVIHLKRTFAPAPRKAGRYAAGRPGLHAAALALVAVSALAGSSLLLGLLEPWAVFGKVAASLLVPMGMLANNALAFLSRRAGSYDLAFVPIAGEAAQAVLALVVFGAIVALAL
ncbi:MAG: 4Fe-4S binding protein, partial [Spirochaetota bacterium]